MIFLRTYGKRWTRYKHEWINFPFSVGIYVSDDQFSFSHLDERRCWGDPAVSSPSLTRWAGQHRVRAHGFASFTPLFSLQEKRSFLVKKCSWGSGMFPPFLVATRGGGWEGMSWAMRKGLIGKFQCSTTYSPIHSSSSIWISRVATAVLPSLSVLSQEKTFSQAVRKHSHRHWTCLISQKYFRHVHRECTCVVSSWMVPVSFGYSWVLYLAPTCPLRGSRSFDLVQATYKCHHTTGMSESS